MVKILFVGGGTAGHVFPAIAVARAARRLDERVEPVFIGTSDRLEDRLVPAAGFPLHHITALPLPRRLSPAILKVPAALNAATDRCAEIIREEGIVGAVTFGGYVSFPASRACGQLGVPLILHEQNAMPGLANRFAGRWADRIAVTFPGSADRFGRDEKIIITGNPVRDEILELDLAARREEARMAFGLQPDRLTVLAFGGSQGARNLNRALVAAHSHWAAPNQVQILHAAGTRLHGESAAGWEKARDRHDGPLVRCVDFIDEMGDAYAAADIVVCRAGATSIAELTALGLPSVLVPYPHATRDHQLHNARALAQVGGAQVIADDELNGRRLVDAVEPWIADQGARHEAARSAEAFGRRDAATTVARLILDLVARAGRPAPMPEPGPIPDSVTEDLLAWADTDQDLDGGLDGSFDGSFDSAGELDSAGDELDERPEKPSAVALEEVEGVPPTDGADTPPGASS